MCDARRASAHPSNYRRSERSRGWGRGGQLLPTCVLRRGKTSKTQEDGRQNAKKNCQIPHRTDATCVNPLYSPKQENNTNALVELCRLWYKIWYISLFWQSYIGINFLWRAFERCGALWGGGPTTGSARANILGACRKKDVPRYHTIFFLAAGFKLALLVKVWYLCMYPEVFFWPRRMIPSIPTYHTSCREIQ